MVFFQINLKKKITITLVMLLSKMEVVGKEVLEDLVVQIFQISLRTFLVILEGVAEEVQEDVIQTPEVQI